ncbi:MAG TPA: hypothetical protein VGF16_18475 [Bryobacteraceae bacterium]|jgi:tetratricopeptide (TPR) repeat protein
MRIPKVVVLPLAALALAAQSGFEYDAVQRGVFAGLMGDKAALQRAMEACEKALADNPNHAQALVWHGIGTVGASGGDFAIAQKGIAEMDRAAMLAPEDLSTRIPRGATLMAFGRQMPDSPLAQAMLEKARSDFQLAFDKQRDHLDQLGTHPLGELLQGLGDVYSRQGKPEEAQKFYELIQSKLKNTEYSRRAAQWKETRQPLPVAQTACIGCHIGTK